MSSTNFKCICKVRPKGATNYIFQTYKTNNVMSLWKMFLDKEFTIAYVNVFAYGGFYESKKGLQLRSYTMSNPPNSKVI